MDIAVALAQAYLRLNGFFTVTEYPIIEHTKEGYREATDLDILAVRFPGTTRVIVGERGREGKLHETDPLLKLPDDQMIMLVGEVKEGKAELNAAARRPAILRAALLRFGCCPLEEVERQVERLLSQGRSEICLHNRSCQLRLVAFGSYVPAHTPGYIAISFGDVISYLKSYLIHHWEVMLPADLKDPAFSLIKLLVKAEKAGQPSGT